jgi:hypothetical protein
VGVAAEAAFVGYLVSQGRRAAAAGATGLLGEEEGRGWTTTPGAAYSRPVAFTRR